MSTATAGATGTDESQTVNIRVYNTLTREKEPFETITPGKVGMYLCGPTVYKPSHIGHMVGPVIFDCIKRYLTYCGYEVTWVVNITDVDDKLIAEANVRGIPMADVATEMTADYVNNLAALGVTQIDEMPKATDHISHIIDFISRLVENGSAYASEGDVYFEVTKDDDYGKLSNRSVESQLGEGGEMASRKRSPGDFALWKSSKEDEPCWDSPWGKGRPGWHIECSAMSHAILGESFDIHGGGLDLMFPHHENEMAQSESCHHKPMAKYWMHNGLMRASSATGKVGGKSDRAGSDDAVEEATVDTKISRSKGAGGLVDLIAEQTGERIRFFVLRSHYRSTSVFGDEPLAEARTALEAFHRFFERYERVTGASFYDLIAPTTRATAAAKSDEGELLKAAAQHRENFLVKMDDDFNTGAAISELFDLVRTLNKSVDSQKLEDASARTDTDLASFVAATTTLKELSGILGLFEAAPQTASGDDDGLMDGAMQILIGIRQSARENKDFALGDRVRDELGKLNITLEDRTGDTGWRLDADAPRDGIMDGAMQVLIGIRQFARENKNFALGDTVRDELAKLKVTLEDRTGGTEWRRD